MQLNTPTAHASFDGEADVASLPFGFGARAVPSLTSQMAVPRIAVFDDDRFFLKTMERAARARDIPLITIGKVADTAKLQSNAFDVAMIDFDLGDMTGVELAESVTEIVGPVPLMLISYTQRRPSMADPWPASIQRFLAKDVGADTMIEHAIALFNRSVANRRRRPIRHPRG